MLNKKSESGETVLWILRVVGTLVLVAALVIIINNSIEKNLEVRTTRYYSLAARLIYSKNCFALSRNGRVFIGMIDSTKLTNDTLQECMRETNLPLGIKVSFYSPRGDNLKSLYYNKDYYEDLILLTFSPKFLRVNKGYIMLNENREPVIMEIDMVWKK